MSPHGLTLGFYPCQQIWSPLRRSNSGQDCQAVAKQVEAVAIHDLVRVKPEVGRGWLHKSLLLIAFLLLPADFQTAHQSAQLLGGLMVTIQAKIRIDDHIHIQSIPHHVLFIAPIAGGQLAHHHPVIRALVLHPPQGLLCCLTEKFRLIRRYSVESQPEEEERRRIAGAAVIWIVSEGWNVAMGRLIISERYQCAFQGVRKLLVASCQKAESRNHQVPGVRFRISPSSGSRQSVKRSLCVMQQDLKSRLFGLLDNNS